MSKRTESPGSVLHRGGPVSPGLDRIPRGTGQQNFGFKVRFFRGFGRLWDFRALGWSRSELYLSIRLTLDLAWTSGTAMAFVDTKAIGRWTALFSPTSRKEGLPSCRAEPGFEPASRRFFLVPRAPVLICQILVNVKVNDPT